MLIGEVSQRSGVSTRMLRHYDALGLVIPTGRTVGGYREYSAHDIGRLFHVECLRTLGLSLNEAKRALDDPDFAPATLVGELIRTPARESPPNTSCCATSSGSMRPRPPGGAR
jgi:DNA-binding transcriptional MerR regulator